MWYNSAMKVRRLKSVLIILFLVSVLLVYLFSPSFELKKILFDEQIQSDAQIIMEQTKIRFGDNLNAMLIKQGNLFTGHLTKAEEILSSDIYKKQIVVNRTGKNDIEISYSRRKPVICILYDEYYLYCDYDGVVLYASKLKEENSIYIEDIELNCFYVGLDISTCTYMFEPVSVLCYEIEKYDKENFTAIRALISNIELKDNNRISIKYDKRIEIVMDMTKDVRYSANVMCNILSQINQTVKGYIDFTISKTPYFTPES